jgi:hypothetical protein
MPLENFKLPEPFAPWSKNWWNKLKLVLADTFYHEIIDGEGIEIDYPRPGRALIEIDYDQDRTPFPGASGESTEEGGTAAPGVPFPVTLSSPAGASGSDTTQCAYTYTVTTAVGGVQLATSLNPASSPHVHNRPSLGEMVAADHGMAYYKADGTLVVYDCNEVPAVEDCTP